MTIDARTVEYFYTRVENESRNARALVIDTGMNTELRRIAGLLQEAKTEPTPLQRALDQTGKRLRAGVVVIAAIVVTTITHSLQLCRRTPCSGDRRVSLLRESLQCTSIWERSRRREMPRGSSTRRLRSTAHPQEWCRLPR